MRDEIARLKEKGSEQKLVVKEEQAKGDAIKWAVYNLDQKNPSVAQDFEHLPPEQLLEGVITKEQRILELMTEIQQSLAGEDFETNTLATQNKG